MSDESYDLDSGLAFTSEVTDAYFETNDEWFQPEVPRLVLETAADRSIRLKTGAGWETNAKGTVVTHPTKTSFNRNSAIGRFLTSIVKLDGGRELLESRGHATEAKIWKGLTLSFDSVEDKFRNDEGEEVPYQVQIVTAIEGDEGKADEENPAEVTIARLDKLWEEVKPDHALFMERAYAEIPEVLAEPAIQKSVENAANWAPI